ncbi:hypothetical protein BDP27DRAFT_1369690 [Rhodocollybia butyracea]|uniref:Uncharacterized protein n=1 Tax=Rhodocollybia butyracea TaxID=206335 RepID=A0A9P5U0H1_9AGAR|nr:hypothetical protein BDP27DRAFT_1369690 [Rhodocollybia butyracea]
MSSDKAQVQREPAGEKKRKCDVGQEDVVSWSQDERYSREATTGKEAVLLRAELGWHSGWSWFQRNRMAIRKRDIKTRMRLRFGEAIPSGAEYNRTRKNTDLEREFEGDSTTYLRASSPSKLGQGVCGSSSSGTSQVNHLLSKDSARGNASTERVVGNMLHRESARWSYAGVSHANSVYVQYRNP